GVARDAVWCPRDQDGQWRMVALGLADAGVELDAVAHRDLDEAARKARRRRRRRSLRRRGLRRHERDECERCTVENGRVAHASLEASGGIWSLNLQTHGPAGQDQTNYLSFVPAPDIASLNPFKTLQRHRNFRLFWFGQTLSLIGTWMQSMSEGWLALELSNSAFLVGLVAAAQSFPILLLSMHAGVVVDRADKLRMVKTAQSLLAVQASVLWWLTWSHHLTIAWLLAMATANGLIVAFEIPARQSLVIELVGREDLPGAIALNSSGFNLARVVGPSIGAIIIARFGIAWCFGVNAFSYFGVLVGLFMIRPPAWLPPERLIAPLEGIREAFDYVRETPTISSLLWLVTVFSVLGVPYLTLMPVVARDKLGLGAGGYGGLLACVGIGGLAGAAFPPPVGRPPGRGALLLPAPVAESGELVAVSLLPSPGPPDPDASPLRV